MGALKYVAALALPLASCTAVVDGPERAGPADSLGSGSSQSNGGAGVTSGTGGVGTGNPATPGGPGAPIVRRLNHREYDNTVRDLLGTTLQPAGRFPADDFGAEFTTVGSSLSLSPTYVRAYEVAAHQLLDELFAGSPERLQKVVSCSVTSDGEPCALEVLTKFASRAWRRPITEAEAQPLLLPVREAAAVGASAEEGLKYALAGVLLSPHFIFKLEIDPSGAPQPRKLTSHELATRLSYALWATMPDEELRSAADSRELENEEKLAQQVDRMLADARADSLVEGFAAEWLDLAKLATHEAEDSLFPQYSPKIGAAMAEEAKAFFAEFLHSSRPVSELFTARFTFVDDALAELYGLAAPPGDGKPSAFRKVDTSGGQRGGLLTLGAFLSTTSYPNRTSPVRRGEFVFSRFMCGEVPSPPMDIPSLPPDMPGLTLRERTELHRSNPSCAACHSLMDPLGFGLENFDAIGRYRSQDAGDTIDSSGVLPDGRAFNGPVELGALLAADPLTTKCLTKKLLTSSVGRLFEGGSDDAWVEATARQGVEAGGSLRSMLRAVVLSSPFRQRQPSSE
ncbi:MAG: DUF1592 domain-containing protein [Myxococcales bacterium]|nr:MAG: DUF1592 domain-containing protein [Myxococcales bacterium]